MRPHTLGIIGLGALGGSVAWRAARAGIDRIVGYDVRPAEAVAAARAGAITEVATTPRGVLRQAELLVLAVPPLAALRFLRQVSPALLARPALLTDVGSVKRSITALAGRLGLTDRFAGSHPFAGTHERGFQAARPDLLAGALVYVCPSGDDDAPARELADFWSGTMGAEPVILDADVHDEIVAWTSHLPQAVASALAVALADDGPRGVTYGRGARDTTRLAAGGADLWRDILLMNRERVLEALNGVDDALGALRRILLDGDAAALTRWLERGARWRRGFDA